ncbi:MAG: LIM domain-containing protein [Roseiflexaceae bacterium]
MAIDLRNPFQLTTRDHCAACGDLLSGIYFALPDRPERYCEHCITTRPRCDACGAPVGEPHWRLHDQRVLCNTCHTTAVYDANEARHLFEETVGAIIAQLHLELREGVAFRLVDAPLMAQIRAQASDGHPADERVLGLYQRRGDVRAIYMLYGLPKLLFRTVVAHEYGHAWQNEYAPRLQDDGLREGFAEWVAYRHLCYLGCTKAARHLLTSQHPYRPLLEQVLEIERQHGPLGVLEHLRRAR